MQFRILGPLEVVDAGRPIAIHRGKEQALLAYLLLHANELVPTDRLIDELWGEAPPPTVRKTLQNAISQLRRALGDGRLVTEAPGYRFRLEPDELDLHRFERLAEEGRAAGDPQALREALALWRGEPLANLRDEPFAARAAPILDEARLSVIEDRIDADLAAGRGADLVPELERLVSAHPLRERLYAQLMLALYRAGRQADALNAYQRARRKLSDEVGLDPGPDLQELERRMLNQDSALTVASRPSASPDELPSSRRPRREVALVAAVVLVLAVAALVAAIATRGGAAPKVVANSLVKIDPGTNKIVDVTRVGRQPSEVQATSKYVFVVNDGDGTLTRIDPKSGATDTIGELTRPVELAPQGEHTLWITTGSYHTVIRLNADTLRQEAVVPLGRNTFFATVGDGSLWVTEPAKAAFVDPGTLARINPETTEVEHRYKVGVVPAGVAVLGGAVWVANATEASLSRINLDDGAVERVSLGASPTNLTTGFGSLWVLVGNTVWRINPATRQTEAVIRTPGHPYAIASGEGAVWVALPLQGILARIDPHTNQVVKRIKIHRFDHALSVGMGAVWVGVGNDGLDLPF